MPGANGLISVYGMGSAAKIKFRLPFLLAICSVLYLFCTPYASMGKSKGDNIA